MLVTLTARIVRCPSSVVTATGPSSLQVAQASQTPSPALCSTDLQWSCRSSRVTGALAFWDFHCISRLPVLGIPSVCEVGCLGDRVRYHFSYRQDENLTHLMAVSNYHVKCPSIEKLRWDASSPAATRKVHTTSHESLTKPPVDIQVATQVTNPKDHIQRTKNTTTLQRQTKPCFVFP